MNSHTVTQILGLMGTAGKYYLQLGQEDGQGAFCKNKNRIFTINYSEDILDN